MATKYIDLANGNELFLTNVASTGINIDVDGEHHFLIAQGFNYYDATYGGVLTSPFRQLLAEAQIPGLDLAITNVATGNRKSVFVGGDNRNINLVSTVLTDWTNTIGTVTVQDMGGGINRVTISNPGATSTLDYNMASLSIDRTGTCEIRLISGSAPSSDFFGFVDNNTLSGPEFTFDNITTNWQEVNAKGENPNISNRLRFRFSGTTTIVFEVRNMRATDTVEASEPFPYGTDAGYTKIDQITVGGIPVVSSMNGATNLVSPDLTEWTTGASVSGEEPVIAAVGDNEFTITIEDTTNISVATYSFAADAADRTCACKMRLDEGMGSIGASDQLVFRSATTVKGTAYTFDNITEDYEDATCKVTSADSTNQLAFRFTAVVGKVIIRVKLMRAVDSAVPHPAFPDGGGAGATYGTDLLSCAPTWGSEGTIVRWSALYGYSVDGPGSSAPRFFNTSNYFAYINEASGGIVDYQGSGTALQSSGTLTANVGSVMSFDWSTANLKKGLRFEAEARQENVIASIPSGDYYISNRDTGDRVGHMVSVDLFFQRVLSDVEYEILRAGLQRLIGSLALV